ncbi:NUDIX hydrolase [Legionella fallonii]|uniref:NUDIX family hydrolase n=1 Tax=Legionella fallonii LLAP-10 TaxID=1212491 RepID=A0A098G691_9GAMM|nr:CoA pyrophosphatase [Legionella fallonii]CEG57025.1 NUDIX family hydrolase [Legionella fallonii LLAP-10]
MGLNKPSVSEAINSAVMVLHELATDSLVLTKRNSQLRHHPGEICFPGGKKDVNDKDLYTTALRELYEELGITADRVTLVKKLQVERTLLGAVIQPWLASIQSVRPYHQNCQEVTSLIYIPMSLVIDPNNYRDLMVKRDGIEFTSCEFIPHDELVWGATARIMKQLIV